jgi:hypothetical protein
VLRDLEIKVIQAYPDAYNGVIDRYDCTIRLSASDPQKFEDAMVKQTVIAMLKQGEQLRLTIVGLAPTYEPDAWRGKLDSFLASWNLERGRRCNKISAAFLISNTSSSRPATAAIS